MMIALRCSCGKLQGNVTGPFRKKYSRAVCLCDDCQSYAQYLGKEKTILDENGGTEIIALYPDQIKLMQGLDQLACMRLTDKGMYRWYSKCCNTAIANSAAPKLPFAGVVHTCLALTESEKTKIFGPVFERFFGKYGKGQLPPKTHQKASIKLIMTTIPFILKGVIQKKHLPNPFFKDDGFPKVEPHILSKIAD